ncbi:MAG: dTDP-4-dehydrorhamnose reductase [Acidimicrobiia bacterium]
MIAVLGATGQLGTAFTRLLGESAVAVSRSSLDMSDPESIPSWVKGERPELIINCAAHTAVDRAEGDEAAARLINAEAVARLAQAAGEHGAALVTFSTDYVFDGTKDTPYVESDLPNPLSAYGRTKLEGERRALGVNPATLVVRTSWLLSATHRNFAATILGLIRRGEARVVDDQRGRPTIATDLAKTAMECVRANASGLLHLTNHTDTTWFDLARDIAGLAGMDDSRVIATTTSESPRPARRPANSMLDSERLEDLGIASLPHYRDSLPSVVEGLLGLGF